MKYVEDLDRLRMAAMQRRREVVSALEKIAVSHTPPPEPESQSIKSMKSAIRREPLAATLLAVGVGLASERLSEYAEPLKDKVVESIRRDLPPLLRSSVERGITELSRSFQPSLSVPLFALVQLLAKERSNARHSNGV